MPAEGQVRTVSARSFLATVAVNVGNKQLSDSEFREFIRTSLEIVNYDNPDVSWKNVFNSQQWFRRRQGFPDIYATAKAAREAGYSMFSFNDVVYAIGEDGVNTIEWLCLVETLE